MDVLMLCALFGRVVRECGCCIVISTYQHAHAYASPQEMRCCEKNDVISLTHAIFFSHMYSCVRSLFIQRWGTWVGEFS